MAPWDLVIFLVPDSEAEETLREDDAESCRDLTNISEATAERLVTNVTSDQWSSYAVQEPVSPKRESGETEVYGPNGWEWKEEVRYGSPVRWE